MLAKQVRFAPQSRHTQHYLVSLPHVPVPLVPAADFCDAEDRRGLLWVFDFGNRAESDNDILQHFQIEILIPDQLIDPAEGSKSPKHVTAICP